MAGLSDLLQRLRGSELDAIGMHSLREANSEAFRELSMSIELPLHAGGTWTWELIDPIKLFRKAVEVSQFFQGLVSQAVRRNKPSPSNPWRLVIGFDEFMPGFKMRCPEHLDKHSHVSFAVKRHRRYSSMVALYFASRFP